MKLQNRLADVEVFVRSNLAVRLAIVAIVLIVAGSPLWADTLTGSVGAGWQSGYTVNENGTPYWDHTSWDGSQKNIGYCLTGTGNCGMSGAPGQIPYWGYSNGTADLNITFAPTGANAATMKIEIAGNAGINQFGYSDINGNHIIFTGPQGAGATATFTAAGSYSFFMIGANGTYYSNAALNSDNQVNFQHFAVFEGLGTGDYWLGIEDLNSSGDKDYNDMVVHVTATSTPEPESFMLFGAGLAALAGAVRRRLL
ncbi:MAG: DUF4114 domain-containing protein [Terriglobales bacterium]